MLNLSYSHIHFSGVTSLTKSFEKLLASDRIFLAHNSLQSALYYYFVSFKQASNP